MAAETTEITERNRREMLSERALLLEVLDRLDQMETRLSVLLGAWSAGGLRGLRQAAGRFTP